MKLAPHSAAWFAKQAARLEEPLENTKHYYTRREVAKIFSLLFPPVGIFLAPIGIYNLIKIRKELDDVETDIITLMNNGRAITLDGPPGSGKTFSGKELARVLAKESWEQLKSDYYTQRTMLAEWVRLGNTDKLEAFKALKESYLFYEAREETNIPCLVSSVPLREFGTGRMSYALTPEVFKQIKRLPEYTVIFNDESGLDQGADTSTTDDKDLLAFWRFCRHFFNGKFVNTNQDGDQNGIYVRRSTDYVGHIYGQEWLRRPVQLEKKFLRKQAQYYKQMQNGQLSDKQAEYIGRELYFLKRYIATIGFRRIDCSVTTTEGAQIKREKVILPAIGWLQYDERAFRNLYKCKAKPIELQGWENLAVGERETNEFDEQANEPGKKCKRRG